MVFASPKRFRYGYVNQTAVPVLHRHSGRNCMGGGTAKPVVVDAAEVAKMVAKFGRLVEVVVAVLDVGLGSELVAYRHWQTDAVYS